MPLPLASAAFEKHVMKYHVHEISKASTLMMPVGVVAPYNFDVDVYGFLQMRAF